LLMCFWATKDDIRNELKRHGYAQGNVLVLGLLLLLLM